MVAVGEAAGDTEDPLGKKIRDPVLDLSRHPAVVKTPGQFIDQAEAGVGSLGKHGSAVGTAIGQVKLRDQGTINTLWEQNTLPRSLSGHPRASV
jgi:hypothetical protein